MVRCCIYEVPINKTNNRIAWRVDFNIGLSGFEPLIVGMRRLMDLAASSTSPGGARLLFVSSVSVLLSTCTSFASAILQVTDTEARYSF